MEVIVIDRKKNILNCGTELHVLSGEDNGKKMREITHLNQYDKDDSEYEFYIVGLPPFTTSFFFGWFGKSMRYLGESGFRQKYHFQAQQNVLDKIEVCIMSYYIAD